MALKGAEASSEIIASHLNHTWTSQAWRKLRQSKTVLQRVLQNAIAAKNATNLPFQKKLSF